MQVFCAKLISAVWLLTTVASSHIPHCSLIDVIPGAESNDLSTADFISSANGLDSPHVKPINASSFDWWYFDVVSYDASYSFSVTFFAGAGTAFPLDAAPAKDITVIYLFLSTPANETLLTVPAFATEATVVSLGNGASGDWQGSGFEFFGAPDLSTYRITIDSPNIGVKGEVFMESTAPAHYPCSPVEADKTMEIMPHIGWSNAVPAAKAHVSINAHGANINFNGIGYHDKNWGDRPFTQLVGSWYWGHGRLGPYTVVWYDALTPTGAEYVSGYVACDGQIISVSCSSTKVRPTGPNSPYPPVIGGGSSGDYHVEIDLGLRGTFVFNVTAKFHTVLAAGEVYDRWTGELSGGIKGEKTYRGTALYEQFAM